MALDPVVLALVQNRLDDVSRHMGWVMTRTARSPIFSQAHDFSCFITDPAGALVSVADGIPIHTGGGGFTVRAVLAAFDGRIDDGDVFLSNDPYEAGGNHLPDWVITRPVFAAGRLVAFACNRAHQSDIGGGAAGAYNSAATEIFHEGLRLPVLKLVESSATRDDVWRLLLLNTRTPQLLDGDLRAMLGSTRIGAERIIELVDELGIDQGRAYFDGILDHAERRFRAAVAKLPDGRYEAQESIDNDCFETVDLEVRLAIEVAGEDLTVDFTGSSPQMRGFKNSSLANTYSAVYMALLAYFDPDLPRNEGAFRGVAIVAPEGSLVNAKAPAPMTMNTIFVAHEIIHAAWKALAQADPAHSCAGWGKGIFGITSGGIGSDNPFVLYHWNCAGGGGGVNGRDGFNQTGHIITLGGLTMHNVESYEQLYPTRFHRQEFRCDSAGAGEYRGGTGVDYEVDIEVPAEHSFRGEGLVHAYGFGVNGGGMGAKGEMTLHPVDGKPFAAPQYSIRRLGPLRLAAASPAGGGWGDPFERDPARVVRDVRDEVISRAVAAEVYGVMVGTDGVDVEATAARRRERSAG